jgi:hypothetical protein
MTPLIPVVLHYGGIDEIGIFVIPAVLAILALRWVEKRARRKREAEQGEGDPSEG